MGHSRGVLALCAAATLVACGGGPAPSGAAAPGAGAEVQVVGPPYAGTLRFAAGRAPAVGEVARACVTLVADDGLPVAADAMATVVLWMPQHGHAGVLSPRLGEPAAHGRWVEDIAVQMSGTWELRLQVRGAAGDERVAFAFDVP